MRLIPWIAAFLFFGTFTSGGENSKPEAAGSIFPPGLERLLAAKLWDNASDFLADDLAGNEFEFDHHRRMLNRILLDHPDNKMREPMQPVLRKVYNDHSRAHPDNPQAQYIAMLTFNDSEQKSRVEEILKKWPDFAWAHFHKAWLLRREGKTELALKSYENAKRLDSYFILDYALLLGEIAKENDSYVEKARLAFEEALNETKKRDLAEKGYYHIFGFASEHEELNEWGVKLLRGAISENPEDADLHAFLGTLLYNKSIFLQNAMEKKEDLDRDIKEAKLEHIGKIRAEAVGSIRKALEIDPDNRHASIVVAMWNIEPAAGFPWTLIIFIVVIGLTVFYVVRSAIKQQEKKKKEA